MEGRRQGRRRTSRDGFDSREDNLLRRRPGELPPPAAASLVASQDAERRQAVQDLLDVGLVRALERAGDLLDGPRGGGLGDKVADGPDLIGQLLWPGRSGCGLRGGLLGLFGGGEPLLGRGLGAAGVLELGAQPASEAASISVGARLDYLSVHVASRTGQYACCLWCRSF